MLRMVLNVSWEDHVKNVDLYATLPRVTDKIRARRMGLAGHYVLVTCGEQPSVIPELVLANTLLFSSSLVRVSL